jgi:DNA polymerase-1
MHILVLDFMNAAHRARSGFQAGDHSVIFNFFRQFKSLVSEFEPTKIYVVLEGRPVKRHESLSTYKSNRIVEKSDPKYIELQKFFKQKDVIVELLEQYFPVSVVRHHTSEADDTIANLVRNSSISDSWTIVSSDTDFIQLLQSHENLRLYNPVRKEFVEAPVEYDYCTWKALRGDSSDNIPGVPKCGDKTAAKIASDVSLLKEFVMRPEVAPIFGRNYDLIRFTEWTEDEQSQMTSSTPQKNWDTVKSSFDSMGFHSITKDDTWQKFISSFNTLWGNQ